MRSSAAICSCNVRRMASPKVTSSAAASPEVPLVVGAGTGGAGSGMSGSSHTWSSTVVGSGRGAARASFHTASASLTLGHEDAPHFVEEFELWCSEESEIFAGLEAGDFALPTLAVGEHDVAARFVANPEFRGSTATPLASPMARITSSPLVPWTMTVSA